MFKSLKWQILFVTIFASLNANEKVISLSSAEHNHLSVELMNTMKDCFGVETLIETGSLVGITAIMAAPIFREIHTIELSDVLFKRTVENCTPYKNITCYHGDSSEDLQEMISATKERILFWLDAHYSAGETAESINGDPVNYEFQQILDANREDSIILLDDIRGHNIRFIRDFMKSADPAYECVTLGDILLVYHSGYHSPEFSPLVKACSDFRLSDSQESIELAERKIIALGSTAEFKELTHLSQQFGGIYAYFEGLSFIGINEPKEAVKSFEVVIRDRKDKNYVNFDFYFELARELVEVAG